jgi:hypothetical protein
MLKKVLLGCFAFVMLAVAGITLVVMLSGRWSGVDGGKGLSSDPDFLSRHLAMEFSGQPDVEFVCRYPVVGPGPCLPNSDIGSREVTLTFNNYEPPGEVTLEEQARRIAIVAFKISAFANNSDEIQVAFVEGSESTSISRKYSFSGEELAASEAASSEAAGDIKAVEE